MSARSLLIALGLLATGCATNGDPRDPLEGLNRGVQAFNDVVDENALQPAARLYRNVTPSGFRDGVRNFFNNLDDLYIGANNLLQGKVEQAMGDLMRVAVNTTLGFFGVIDWASDMGLEKHNEDFGQTLALWGVGDGVYLVLPLLGPSTLRDAAALPVDWEGDPVLVHTPVDERNALTVTRVVARRADLLGASRTLEEAALDRYVFLRESWLQRRRSQVYDGRPPRERPPAD
ncbi:MAG: VacJ family lipoprotein [Betaproteobacteria bacterium]|nr:VacJ family lipoprotein [Betaproteobacteria bacterium]MDH4323681.1 VacJ family lipoprotein [Betaproteobacteria bacterium]